MPDPQQQTYYTLLTQVGAADWTNAQVFGFHVPITQLAVGDGGGSPVLPTEDMQSLVNERFRININSIAVDSENPNWLVIEAVLPANVGGWTIREIGLIGGLNPENIALSETTPGNKLLAVGNFPETYKPLLAEGAAKDLAIRMILQVANAEVVKLILDPTVVVATKKSVEQAIQNHRQELHPHDERYTPLSHVTAPDPHPQYFNEPRLESRLQQIVNGTLHYVGQVWQIVADADALHSPAVTGADADRADGVQVIVTDYPSAASGHALATWSADAVGWTILDLPLAVFDLYGCDLDNHGYYWFADGWNLLDLDNIGDATEEAAGVIRLATPAEVETGEDMSKAVTPATLGAALGRAVPPGTVIYTAMPTAPDGYLEANGALLSRAAYADLFAAIGETFGAGDGETTFAIPDLRGEFLRGWDGGRGVDAGRVFGSSQAAGVQSHAHTFTALASEGASADSYSLRITSNGSGNTVWLQKSRNTTAAGSETRPRNIALLACIKY
ncbi:MAG: phage tail protein [Zoogloeaceae bacterium]|nr:phage tail protein [Zoogloeaceae bacterium]